MYYIAALSSTRHYGSLAKQFELRYDVSHKMKLRPILGIVWLAFVGAALFMYFFHPDLIRAGFERVVAISPYLAYAILLILGCIRGFTLVPITYLIVIGLIFFPPLPLLIIILIGAIVSSASVYYFFEYLNLDEYFEKKHAKEVHKIKAALEKNELPIIIAWSAMPFLPTDVICYVCGSLEVSVKKMLLGIFIGEGITCTIYVFFGKAFLEYLHLGF